MAFFSTQRTATAMLPALAGGGSASMNFTWPKPFPDTLYRVSAGFYDPAGGTFSFTRTATTKNGCTGTVKNLGLTALTGGTAQVELTATHD